MIVAICKRNVQAITLDTFEFVHGPKAVFNLTADNAKLPAAWMGYPVISNDTYQKTGYLEGSFPVEIFFGHQSSLDATQEKQDELIERARAAAQEFINRLAKDEDVRSFNSVSRIGIENLTDACLTGCLLKITIVPMNTTSHCVS